MTTQERMKATLAKTGIPYREIRVYGNQIVVTSLSEGAADRWATLLSRFAKVRGVIQALDDRKVKVPYRGSTMAQKYVPVWRTFAAVA